MSIQEQIKELNEHLDHFESEKLRLFEEIRKIRVRQEAGRIYGTEAQEIATRNKQLQKLITKSGTKEREKQRLEKQLESSKQQPIFS